MFQNKNALVLIVAFGFAVGSVNTYGTIVGIIADQYGYSSDAASLFGAVFIFGALLGSGIAGAYVETTRKYRFVTILLALLGSIFPIVLLFCL